MAHNRAGDSRRPCCWGCRIRCAGARAGSRHGPVRAWRAPARRIDIPEINAEELASLRVASLRPRPFEPQAWNTARRPRRHRSPSAPAERPPLPEPVQRPAGQRSLRRLILETSWASGRIVRDYTMLFDPPALRQSAPPVARPGGPRSLAPPLPRQLRRAPPLLARRRARRRSSSHAASRPRRGSRSRRPAPGAAQRHSRR